MANPRKAASAARTSSVGGRRRITTGGPRRIQSGQSDGPQRQRYLVTFPAGLAALVEECLRADLRLVSVSHRDDSALLFSTSAPAESVAKLLYVKNAFQLVLEVPRTSLSGAAKAIAQRLRRSVSPGLERMSGFRIMAQIDGQLEPLDRHAKGTLERAVMSATGARVMSRGGGDELWLIGRRALGTIVLGRRLSRAAKPGPAGSLSPELSRLLVRMSKPQGGDVFLDPFAGSGALCRARAEWPARRVIGVDLYAEPRFDSPRARAPIEFLREDALELPSVESGSASVVATDPPWGEFESFAGSAQEFYAAMAASFRRVLDPRTGRLVLLVSRKMEQLVADELIRAGFEGPRLVPVLVNGHPATVLNACPAEARDDGG